MSAMCDNVFHPQVFPYPTIYVFGFTRLKISEMHAYYNS
jgi:hypothetical protein